MPMKSAQVRDFRSVAEPPGDGSKNGKLSYSHAGFDASTDRKAQNSGQAHSDHEIASPDDGLDIPRFLDRRPGAVPPDRPPVLGPEGDSLDDFQ
jgi:hypothetical protein